VDKEAFRRACASFPTGVTVATAVGTDGAPHGLTVSSFTSVSLSPPLVLVCIGHSSTVLKHFRASPFFGINILREANTEVSEHFARKGRDRFNGVEWLPGKTGAPLLPDALAVLECKRTDTVGAGDHDILIGKVVRAEWREGRPLVYFGSAYRRLEP
jgi:flavin reductase (DIM6/NTAB) family NADH-FMN oxidoreductase RutF